MTEPPLYVKRIKLGFVGAGGIARVQARYLKEIPSVEIVAVADVDRGRALDFAKTWCIPKHNVFTDYLEMMDVVEMDAVTVCTPHAIHSRPAIEALKRDLHV
ncbi:MAG: gfo/Idh/MocA family oxidoreductase, partial [Thermoprotei archaeon]